METDLKNLAQINAAETAALTFFVAMASACLTAGLGWLATMGLPFARQSLFGGTMLITGIFTAWFFVQWRLAVRQRPPLLQQLHDLTAPTR